MHNVTSTKPLRHECCRVCVRGWQRQASSSAHCRWLPANEQRRQNGMARDVPRFIMYRACLVWSQKSCFSTSGAQQHTAGSSAVPERRMGPNSTTDYPETRVLFKESVNAGVIMVVTHSIEHYWQWNTFLKTPVGFRGCRHEISDTSECNLHLF